MADISSIQTHQDHSALVCEYPVEEMSSPAFQTGADEPKFAECLDPLDAVQEHQRFLQLTRATHNPFGHRGHTSENLPMASLHNGGMETGDKIALGAMIVGGVILGGPAGWGIALLAAGCAKKETTSRKIETTISRPQEEPPAEEDENQTVTTVQSLLIDLGHPRKIIRELAAGRLYQFANKSLSPELQSEMVDPLIAASKDKESESVRRFAIRALEKLFASHPPLEIRGKIAARLAEYREESTKPQAVREFEEITRKAREYQRQNQAVFDEVRRMTEGQKRLGERFQKDLEKAQRKTREMAGDISRRVDLPDTWREAIRCYRQGDAECAINKFNEVAELSPPFFINAKSHLAVFYWKKLNDPQKAKEILLDTIKAKPNEAKPYMILGATYLLEAIERQSTELLGRAEGYLDQALKLDPTAPTALTLKGILHYAKMVMEFSQGKMSNFEKLKSAADSYFDKNKNHRLAREGKWRLNSKDPILGFSRLLEKLKEYDDYFFTN